MFEKLKEKKKYQWKNEQWKKRCKIYDWVSLVFLVLAVVGFFISDDLILLVFGSLVVSIVFTVMAYRLQKKDKTYNPRK